MLAKMLPMLRIIGLLSLAYSGCQSKKVRKYYLAAEDVEWDYAPTNTNVITGEPIREGSIEGDYLLNGPDRIGRKYIKSRFFGYADDTFRERIPRPQHEGILGPTIYGEVGETIEILFKNMASRPYSLHTHGMLYNKEHEGAKYNDNTPAKDKVDDSIPPGSSYTYEWRVDDISGPGIGDPDCIAWPYHTHIVTAFGTNTGLAGASIICRPGTLDDYGKRKDVDRDVVLLVTTIDENSSYYIDRNIHRYCRDPDSVDPEDDDFIESNLMHSINGYVFGNLPGLDVCLGDRVAWHVFSLGTETDLHTTYFHGNVLNVRGNRRDAVSTYPALFRDALMEANNPGTWLLTSEVLTHRLAGSQALYHVLENCNNHAYVVETPVRATRRYYIKAEEVIWNYAPSGVDGFNHLSLDDPQSPGYPYFVDNAERIGGSYKKALFFEYTDATFSRKIQKDDNLGILGPVIRAEVGDEVLVTFFNDASRSYSIHAHGVLYDKANEGAGYQDGTSGSYRTDDSVPPGGRFTYRWTIPENYGPVNSNDKCLTWQYYSAVHVERDVNSGLVGHLVVCRPGELDSRESDGVTELHLLLMNANENRSWYIDDNIRSFTNLYPHDALEDEDFLESNIFYSINGYSFANLPGLDEACVGADISWHLSAFGSDQDQHSIYFRGHPVTIYDQTTDTVNLTPGRPQTVRMTPTRTGTWAIECMTGDHFIEGMKALYSVQSVCSDAAPNGDFINHVTVRTYYIAAIEVDWDYVPVKINPIDNKSLLDEDSDGNIFVRQDGPFIGSVYKKAIFRQYTDATFRIQTHNGPQTASLGILGPLLRAEVGDQIKIVFKNMASRAYSVHPHGLRYQSFDTTDQAVKPGETYTYIWEVPSDVGPGEGDRDCILYAYYSDVNRVKDIFSGLVGPLVVCRKGVLGPDGRRSDVDREFPLLFNVFNENDSWYLDENIDRFSPVPSLVDKEDGDFEESNLMHAVNGFMYGNLKYVDMYVGETVEFYLMSLGEEVDIHTVHFHGNPVVYQQWSEHNVDVVGLFAGLYTTVQMPVQEAGTWLLHCHVNDHMIGGMEFTYTAFEKADEETEDAPSRSARNSGIATLLLLSHLILLVLRLNGHPL